MWVNRWSRKAYVTLASSFRSSLQLALRAWLVIGLLVMTGGTVWLNASPPPVEARAAATRSKTVQFFGGQYASTTADNHNVKNDFAAQTMHLAETGVTVTDAYVEFTAQIGGNTSTTYNSAYLYFDVCTPACTPSTTAFTTTAGLGPSVRAESQYMRFRAQVSAEADLAAYTGGGADRTFQIGYCFATTASCTGTASAQIQGAAAKLFVTYTYAASSATQTNTVNYPLESAADVGSATTYVGNCTVDSNCPLFSYNADIPEITSQKSQWFDMHLYSNAVGGTDETSAFQVDGNATGPTHATEADLTNNGGYVNYLSSGLAGYANNTAQQLEWVTGGLGSSVISSLHGGETVVTYTSPKSAATKTKTVTYPVGEIITTVGTTTKSALVGPTVFLPESGRTIKKAWFRVSSNVNAASTGGTINLTHKVGNNAESAVTAYDSSGETYPFNIDGTYNYLIPASQYAELNAASGTAGKAVQMSAQWLTASKGAVNAELVITYQYTGDTNGYLANQTLFAGQQTAAPATTYTTATGAIAPAIPENIGTVTIRGASQWMSGKNTGTTTSEAMGANLSTGACTATNTTTNAKSAELTNIGFRIDKTANTVNTPSQTYTACYSSSNGSVFSGSLNIVYQWDAPILEQAAYRWFNNADSTNVGSPLAALNTSATSVPVNSPFRLRMLMDVSGGQLPASVLQFKLQYALRSGTCDTAFVGETYADVPTSSGDIVFHNNAAPADGTSLTTNANDPTHGGPTHTVVGQTYEEANNFTNTALIPAGQDGMWDFALNDAAAFGTYCLRMVESDGLVLDGYTQVPEILLCNRPPLNNTMRHGAFFCDGAERAFYWST